MDGQAALWAAILASGVYHGLNPGMGWPLAVAAGLTERRGTCRRTHSRAARGWSPPVDSGRAAAVRRINGTARLDPRDPHRRRPGDHRVFGSVASLSAPPALARTRAPHSGDALVVFCSTPARGRADAGSDVTGPLRASWRPGASCLSPSSTTPVWRSRSRSCTRLLSLSRAGLSQGLFTALLGSRC